ncbi:hypothetical protein [Actinoplanes sp. NPDC020271]|uniref:hypothetical protein n=1 Tax=Actinoplanes sp. NPDC020271 TaxID=3363896 RepID=UPI00378AD4BA
MVAAVRLGRPEVDLARLLGRRRDLSSGPKTPARSAADRPARAPRRRPPPGIGPTRVPTARAVPDVPAGESMVLAAEGSFVDRTR